MRREGLVAIGNNNLAVVGYWYGGNDSSTTFVPSSVCENERYGRKELEVAAFLTGKQVENGGRA